MEALKAGKDTVYWDTELLGFGVRVYPTGRKVCVVQTRADGKSKRVANRVVELLSRIYKGAEDRELNPEGSIRAERSSWTGSAATNGS